MCDLNTLCAEVKVAERLKAVMPEKHKRGDLVNYKNGSNVLS